jgi:hypothetical protein
LLACWIINPHLREFARARVLSDPIGSQSAPADAHFGRHDRSGEKLPELSSKSYAVCALLDRIRDLGFQNPPNIDIIWSVYCMNAIGYVLAGPRSGP